MESTFHHSLINAQPIFWRLVRTLVEATFAFQRGHLPQESVEELFQLDDDETDFSRIRCPLCQWQPSASSLWYCGDWGHPEYFFDGCGMYWNTFETRGLCPGCAHQWRWTSCLRCEDWSLHEDWYAEERL